MIKRTPQPRQLFLVATGYWKTSKILSKYLETTHDFDVVSPIFVNIAFAGEVYLKCLHLIRANILPRGHNLGDLFDKLPSPDRAAIETLYKRNIDNCPIAREVKRQFPKIDLQISTVLAEAGKVFEQWRYIYESEPAAPTSLGDFVDALQQHLRSIDPALETALHAPLEAP